ncbi:hypothetical protein EKO27_g5322 [Xylaria grammica]|uniref:Ribonuclease n=1 Tax=Xylaria grammica TaxID=363999 RepID=A0A439D5U8_9PEZI|nr:hypothetical protein EKO27_g5322 [Xylaria grammica]
MEDTQIDEGNVALETPVADVFVPPSIYHDQTLCGKSYTHFSPVPPSLAANESDPSTGVPCVLGVDEAGRGPVLGPMVYGVFYLPIPQSEPLLKSTHHFDDSKVLTPAVRSSLMESLCTADTDLHDTCGWAISSLSARDIGANMMRPAGATYNLNAQAMDATAALIQGVMARGVNVREIYVDTIGQPATYQRRLERIFPTVKITVAKKADSLYPCVSAASVCAKVTRDARSRSCTRLGCGTAGSKAREEGIKGKFSPGDLDILLMRGVFSWGTAKDMLETKGGIKVEWPADDEESTSRLTDFFAASGDREKDADELGTWFGTPAGLEAF